MAIKMNAEDRAVRAEMLALPVVDDDGRVWRNIQEYNGNLVLAELLALPIMDANGTMWANIDEYKKAAA